MLHINKLLTDKTLSLVRLDTTFYIDTENGRDLTQSYEKIP